MSLEQATDVATEVGNLRDLAAKTPDTPGVLAEQASALARAANALTEALKPHVPVLVADGRTWVCKTCSDPEDPVMSALHPCPTWTAAQKSLTVKDGQQ
jgi:hypothetical protein